MKARNSNPRHLWGLERLSSLETRARIRADYLRLATLLETRDAAPAFGVWCHPSFVCVLLYRLSNHLYRSGHGYASRGLWHLNTLLTGADISPAANLGEGLLIYSPPGTAIMGTAGRNLTVMPLGGLGGELGRHEDIGAGPGMPLLGDDVTLEPNCGVLGPVRVGHRVHVSATAVVTRDVPDDMVVVAPPTRFIPRKHEI